jgi:hypothetical protein
MNPCDVLHSWVGVDKALRDFQGSSWALEVKTTSTNNPQKVTINSERQLDETLLENLFCFIFRLRFQTPTVKRFVKKWLQSVESLSNIK